MRISEINQASKILFEHKLNKTGLNSLNDMKPSNIVDAYRIQDQLKIHYLTLKNNFCIGKKNWLYF